jgi:hypothetical protein
MLAVVMTDYVRHVVPFPFKHRFSCNAKRAVVPVNCRYLTQLIGARPMAKKIHGRKYDKLPPNDRAKLKARLDKAFGEYIKLCGNYRCEIAGHGCRCGGPMQPNHLITRANLAVRWDEDNCVCGCAAHNTWAHFYPVEWANLWRSLWPERAARLDLKRQTARNMDTGQLEALLDHYESAIKGCVPK